MRGTSVILAAVAIIAITADIRAEGVPIPQQSVEYISLTIVSGFDFERKTDLTLPSSSTAQQRTVATTSTRIGTRTGTGTGAPTPVPMPLPTTEDPKIFLCIENCPTSSVYNPVCGTDGTVYPNPTELECARNCGRNVSLARYGRC